MGKTNITLFGYGFLQVTLLVIHYVLGYPMPWYALWFPTLLKVGLILSIVLVLTIVAICIEVFL